jgi:hypothetical protein
MINIEEDVREQIAQVLPDALRVALNSYQEIITHPLDNHEGNYIKKHGELQDSGRKTLAHIQLMIKIAAFLNLPDARAPDHNNQILLATLLQEANDEVKANCETPDGGA